MRPPSRLLLPASVGLALVGLPSALLAQGVTPPSTPHPSRATPPEGARAVIVPAARPTGFYFRAGPTLALLDPSELQFHAAASRNRAPATFTGKDLNLQQVLLPGLTLGVNIDAAWFYARVGVDIYGAPDVHSTLSVTSESTHVLWGDAGARLVVGPVALLAGVHLGALLMNMEQKSSDGRPRSYGAVEAIYAGTLGVQWRPLRWLQVDAAFAQDIGLTRATMASIAVNLGWSRPAR